MEATCDVEAAAAGDLGKVTQHIRQRMVVVVEHTVDGRTKDNR